MIRLRKGQAVIETLIVFPLIIATFTFFTLGIYLKVSYYLIDYWTQDSALCLAKDYHKTHCLRVLNDRVKSLAFTHLNIESFHRSKQLVFVKVSALFPMNKTHTFTYQTPWPIDNF